MRKWPDAPLIRYLSFANSEVVLINSLGAFKEVLQTKCYSFVKPDFFARLIGEIAGKGLLLAEGDEHRKQRKLLAGMVIRVQMNLRELAEDVSAILT
jgi:cytochrome P450